MRIVEPKVFLMGETTIVHEGLEAYLRHIGVPEWKSDAPTDAEEVVEVMGRICYRSFGPDLNPNVTKVTEGNLPYIQEKLIGKGHGSVLQHPVFNFIFADVSRVFTHELVRHRVGLRYDDKDELSGTRLFEFIELERDAPDLSGISQESLRYVRFDNVSFWVPEVIKENPEAYRLFLEKIGLDEEYQRKLTVALGIEKTSSFEKKKVATSAMRRVVGMGVATTVGWSANSETVRHCLEMRTAPGAEEEARFVFGQVGAIVRKRFPNLFADYEVEVVDGHPWYKTANRKV